MNGMKKGKMILFAGFLALATACGTRTEEPSEAVAETPLQEEKFYLYGFDTDTLSRKVGKVGKGEFFSNLLMHNGLSAQEACNLSMACDTIFDVRKLRVGNPYEVYYELNDSLQTRPRYIVYSRDRVRQMVFDCREPYAVYPVSKPVTTRQRYAEVTIDSSLWNDMTAAGVSPLLVVNLSDIYAWTVDFFGLQKGDGFKVLYDEQICDGEVVAIDTVRYAVFNHDAQEFPAVMYNAGDGGNIYWNEKGESLRKTFLKAPLKFTRISSGFSMHRRHPVTHRVQPHTGVDYAAPTGTPVVTIGDGVVTGMRHEGAGGNVVRIKHNSVYRTAYLHLSRYAAGLKVGDRVRQGQVIGYVGATGRVTGPHLDFRVWKNNAPVNPLNMQSPPAEPLPAALLPALDSTIAVCKARIAEIKGQHSAQVNEDENKGQVNENDDPANEI